MPPKKRSSTKKGIKQPVAPGFLKPRASRHGKPLAEVFKKRPIVDVKRGVRLNAETGEAEVYNETVFGPERAMTPAEIQQAREGILRATAPTSRKGLPNQNGGKK